MRIIYMEERGYVNVVKILTHKKSLHVRMNITCLLSSLGQTDRPGTVSQLTERFLVYIIIVISKIGSALRTKRRSCWSPWTLVLCCGNGTGQRHLSVPV